MIMLKNGTLNYNGFSHSTLISFFKNWVTISRVIILMSSFSELLHCISARNKTWNVSLRIKWKKYFYICLPYSLLIGAVILDNYIYLHLLWVNIKCHTNIAEFFTDWSLKSLTNVKKINNIVARNYDLLTRSLQFCLLQCGYLYPNDINNEILLICTNCIA